MDIYFGLDTIKKINKSAITIGTYDGVHSGHQKVLNKLVESAQEKDLTSTVITFSPHPRIVLGNFQEHIKLIDTEEEKYEKIKKTGVDAIVVVHFDKEFSQLSYKTFVEDFLLKKIGLRYFIFGKDHKFGRQRQGNAETLKELSLQHNFEVEYVDIFSENNVDISSTRIRKAIEGTNIELANKMLNNFYKLKAEVVEGRKIGRNLGFPTANLSVNNRHKIIPGSGVYAVKVKHNNRLYNAMLNIGQRPTFNELNSKTIEVHIFDFEENIYNAEIEVDFVKFLRTEKKFDYVEELKQQLTADKESALRVISSNNQFF